MSDTTGPRPTDEERETWRSQAGDDRFTHDTLHERILALDAALTASDGDLATLRAENAELQRQLTEADNGDDVRAFERTVKEQSDRNLALTAQVAALTEALREVSRLACEAYMFDAADYVDSIGRVARAALPEDAPPQAEPHGPVSERFMRHAWWVTPTPAETDHE
jgi:hypothetical protein